MAESDDDNLNASANKVHDQSVASTNPYQAPEADNVTRVETGKRGGALSIGCWRLGPEFWLHWLCFQQPAWESWFCPVCAGSSRCWVLSERLIFCLGSAFCSRWERRFTPVGVSCMLGRRMSQANFWS